MPTISLNNDTAKTLCIWVEPWGEDYWMKPKERFTVATETPEGVHSDEAPFDVSFRAHGVSVCVNIGYEAVVYDQSGTELDCGHQRPLEVLRTWTESAEAAAQRIADSSIVRTMREYAGLLRRGLTQAEATDQQAQERPPSP
ncbi:hypothetical protein ACFWAR_26430 [Streptomyces sp. NPDC059917]|uniref:hypothetical protein n=1 Tax=Streptomyces sp. NPDC059917 TaxID=3347002 RepID=UPI00364B8419